MNFKGDKIMRIGRKVRVLKDKNREEIFNSSNENRRVVISIFYPVDDNWNAYKLFVLDELNYINNYDKDFKGKLDIEKVGVIGFSLGSQGAFEAAADDKRIKAVALFEGCLHYSKVLDRVKEGERTGTPHLLIKRHASSHRLRVDECYSWYENMEDREKAEKLVKNQIETACKITETQKALYEYINGFKSFVKINYSQHMTFCDMPILSNEKYAECLGGKITIKRAHEIINKTTISFFNEFLKGNFNEYQDFVEKENGYSELVEIDGAGEIKLY